MPTKKSSTTFSDRAWRLLRLAFQCARKGSGSAIKRVLRHLKSLRDERNSFNYRLHYGEHELSFDETPTFQFKKRGGHFFPCVDVPLVSFDDEEECGGDDSNGSEEGEEDSPPKGIDSQAEEFISRFYREMELQRQVSFLRYSIEA